MGDIVEPGGVQYQLPIPLLRSHDHAVPIGTVDALTVTPQGIEVSCTVARGIAAADNAWAEIQQGIMPSLSIGFRGLESMPIKGGRHWMKWELLELSIVAVPANASARIQRVSGAKGMPVDTYRSDFGDRIVAWEEKGREAAAAEYSQFGFKKPPSEIVKAITAMRVSMYCGLLELDARLRKLEASE
jgi:HK97 family phage prohead protease